MWDADLSHKKIDSLLNYETVKYFSAENHEKEKYLKSLKTKSFLLSRREHLYQCLILAGSIVTSGHSF